MSQETDLISHIKEIEVIKNVLPEWTNLQNHEFQFERLSGFTNITYRVIDLQKKRLSLIFKKFSKVEGLLERQYENRILIQGSQKGIGPKCYFADDQYRIQEDIIGAVHPKNQQLQERQLLQKIIIKISEFHKLKLDAIENMTTFAEYILSNEYIEKAKNKISGVQFNNEEQAVVDRITSYFEETKLQQLRNILLPKQPNMIKLCHNDLNNLNIMLAGQETYLIDYEYSRYNHVAYDIANFLSESSINYTLESTPFFEFLDDLLPTRKQIEWICEQYLKNSRQSNQVQDELIQSLSDDVERCFGLCNWYWAVWSPMTKNPLIFFDYMEHGLKRLQRFERVLNKLIAQQKND